MGQRKAGPVRGHLAAEQVRQQTENHTGKILTYLLANKALSQQVT